MSKGLLDTIFDSIFDAGWVGRRGEKLTERELKLVNFLGRHGKTLRNVYVPQGNGKTSEIDLVYITQKGIFVFESKNYSGWVFGDEKSQYWTVMLPNRQKSRFYNPIKQNRTHCKWLGTYLGDDIPLFSIVVFSERCELKKVTVESSDIKVIKRDRTYATVRSIWDSAPDALTEEIVDKLYGQLKTLTDVDAATKAAHIESIEKRYHRNERTVADPVEPQGSKNTPAVGATKICPRCGSELVLRVAKKGSNAGKQFYGYSSFPKCRYTENIDQQ